MPTFTSLLLLSELEKQVKHFLHKVEQWQAQPPAILQYKESPNKWSVTQCLMHLNSYGNYYLPAIKTSLEKAEQKGWRATKEFTPSLIGNWFTNLMLPREGQQIKKMKSPKNYTPVANENSDAALATFKEQGETLLQLLQKAQRVNLKKTKTPISLTKLIRLPVGDTFRFLIAHIERHMIQAQRALEAAGKAVLPINS